MPTVSVIVVTYNSSSTISKCLASIPDACEVVVVDNASSDGTADLVKRDFRQVALVRSERNLGFGAANNIGLRQATGEFALLLNPDAEAEPGAIEALTAFMEQNEAAVACGGKLLNEDGSLQQSACGELTLWAVFCEQFYLERLLGAYWISHRAATAPMRVAQVMGACLMMRRVDEAFLEFDPRFFLYCEDTEFCRRLACRGGIFYLPTARFTHALGTSSATERWRAVAYYNRGKELYFQIHHGRAASLTCLLMDRLGAAARLLAWSVATAISLGMMQRAKGKPGLFLKVLFAPLDPYPTLQV